ncbi:MAG: alpha/beta hydrolase-fold protein [Pyrinomonadaceae bacterium]
MKRIPLFLTIFFVFVSAVAAQTEQVASVAHYVHKINSKFVGEERTVLVRVPLAYRQQPTSRFPVLYMLDAHPPQNAMMAGIVEQQAWGDKIPEMIIVGIQNTNRTRDMTPTATEIAGSGGAEKFLDFIEKELIPMVEQNYRTQPYRIFAGHSLGGLLAIHTLVTRPQMFNAYIAASPVLNWDKDIVIKCAEQEFKKKAAGKRTVFVALGNEPEYQSGCDSFRDLVKRSKPDGLDIEFQQFKDESHGSVVLPAYFGGLRKIYDGWSVSAGSVAELEGHYKKLTERFGYRISVPEQTMNLAAYQLLRANRIGEAINAFKRNTENYPDSANTFDSLAEAYEKDGQTKKALESYERAYKMAEKLGDNRLAASAKANFERISKKN